MRVVLDRRLELVDGDLSDVSEMLAALKMARHNAIGNLISL